MKIYVQVSRKQLILKKGLELQKKTTYIIRPVKEFNPEQIRQIRNNVGMTQTVFANYMGVLKNNSTDD